MRGGGCIFEWCPGSLLLPTILLYDCWQPGWPLEGVQWTRGESAVGEGDWKSRDCLWDAGNSMVMEWHPNSFSLFLL